MDLLTLQKKSQSLDCRSPVVCPGGQSKIEAGERAGDLVKRIAATKPTKNRWGGKDYPINVADYHEFMGALQSLTWILRDMGFECCYLTRNGLTYDQNKLMSHASLVRRDTGKVVALVASGGGNHFRFSRDQKTLRIRRFDAYGQAIAPMADGIVSGSKPISKQAIGELVKVMTQQSELKPDPDSLIKWGRKIMNKGIKPYGTVAFQGRMKSEFRKVGGRL